MIDSIIQIEGLRKAYQSGTLSTPVSRGIALARALAGDPDLILADEPTASLDMTSGLNAMQLLLDLTRNSGKTTVVVTHDSRILHMADRILRLEDGSVVSETLGSNVPVSQTSGSV